MGLGLLRPFDMGRRLLLDSRVEVHYDKGVRGEVQRMRSTAFSELRLISNGRCLLIARVRRGGAGRRPPSTSQRRPMRWLKSRSIVHIPAPTDAG